MNPFQISQEIYVHWRPYWISLFFHFTFFPQTTKTFCIRVCLNRTQYLMTLCLSFPSAVILDFSFLFYPIFLIRVRMDPSQIPHKVITIGGHLGFLLFRILSITFYTQIFLDRPRPHMLHVTKFVVLVVGHLEFFHSFAGWPNFLYTGSYVPISICP